MCPLRRSLGLDCVILHFREESGDHPGDHKLLTCKDAPADIQVNITSTCVVTAVVILNVYRKYGAHILMDHQ